MMRTGLVAALNFSFALLLARPSAAAQTAQAPTVAKAVPANAEDCVVVDPLDLKADNVRGEWRVMLSPNASLDYGADRSAAARAVEVIQHYHFTRQCFVKRPYTSMMYWRNGVAVPPGNMPGQDCIALHPENVAAIYADGRWKVMDGSLWLLDFSASRDAAAEAVRIIKSYSLNRECFVSRPHVAMQYWLSE
ncbi:MAG TPA: hypothetical protein VMU22_00110 [Rhizomicrobium sp.]|nr:hypothetical protein [Rhizomicrobium sp.]